MLCNPIHNTILFGGKDLIPRVSYLLSCSYYKSPLLLKQQKEKIQKETIERTISAEDVENFSKITGDFNSIHTSSERRPGVVHGALLNGIVSGVIGTKLPGNGTVVISQTLNFPKPCYVGDTVLVSVEIEGFRKVMSCKYQVVNKQSQLVLMEGEAKLLYKKPD